MGGAENKTEQMFVSRIFLKDGLRRLFLFRKRHITYGQIYIRIIPADTE